MSKEISQAEFESDVLSGKGIAVVDFFCGMV